MGFSCPQCESKAFKRNGYTRHGKQNHRCLDCGRQFSLEPAEVSDCCNEMEFILGTLVEGNCSEISS